MYAYKHFDESTSTDPRFEKTLKGQQLAQIADMRLRRGQSKSNEIPDFGSFEIEPGWGCDATVLQHETYPAITMGVCEARQVSHGMAFGPMEVGQVTEWLGAILPESRETSKASNCLTTIFLNEIESTIDTRLGREAKALASLGTYLRLPIEEHIEDGVESTLSGQLRGFFSDRGIQAITSFSSYSDSITLRPEALREGLKALAYLRKDLHVESRQITITSFLEHASMLVREQAALSLELMAAFGNAPLPSALGSLKSALQRETSPYLRTEFKRILGELQNFNVIPTEKDKQS